MPALPELTDTHLEAALAAPNGRSAEVLVHDGPLRQSIVALRATTELGEHNAPPAASLQVLVGEVRVTAPDGDVDLAGGDLWLLTHERHAVLALTDAVFLLTTVTSIPKPD